MGRRGRARAGFGGLGWRDRIEHTRVSIVSGVHDERSGTTHSTSMNNLFHTQVPSPFLLAQSGGYPST